MTSHELAKRLLNTASVLFDREDVDLDTDEIPIYIYFWNKKEEFLRAVRAMKTGEKSFDSSYVTFKPKGTVLQIKASRETICHKIQEEKWSCESLLSEEEVSKMGS